MISATNRPEMHQLDSKSHPGSLTSERTEARPRLLDRYGLTLATSTTLLALAAGWVFGALDLIGREAQIGWYLIAYLAGGSYATIEAVRALWHHSIEIDLLMVTAAIGAAIISHWEEGAILLFLFSLGNTLEHYAMGRTYSAIRALMDLRPEEALVVRDGVEMLLPVEELRLSETVIVRPGERIAADGDVIRGESAVDQSAITGESMPVTRRPGESVFAGTINGHGVLHLSVTRLANESTLAKIIDIVDQAQAQKSTTQRFTDRFEGRYAAGVILAAALYTVLPALLTDRALSDTFYQAMILLVVASPCALVISTPASTLSALANAARQGILFKGSAHLEEMGVARVVAFDKTGTLTVGHPRMTDLIALPGSDETSVLRLAASAERHSEHPLATAIVEASSSRGIVLDDPEHVDAIVGRGIDATIAGMNVLVGNDALFDACPHAITDDARAIANSLHDEGKTTMYVAVRSQERNGDTGDIRLLGVIAVADTIRPVAREVIEQLKTLGVERTVILTGDNERAAGAIALRCGVDDFRAGLLPAEKLEIIEELKRQYGTVVMVGDGVNDAPALAAASIGVAMGAAGTDVALETADVVLMADDLTRLPSAIGLSRRTRHVIRQNLTIALGVIVVLVSGTLLGMTTLPIGVIGHEGSTIVVVANGLRLLGGVDHPPRPSPRLRLQSTAS